MKREMHNRKEEIIDACENLYRTESFKNITIKNISEKTTFSRPSIYNYFHTKEEIFLALFKREYEYWIIDLNELYDNNIEMTIENFSSELAKTLEKRTNLLKLLSMNMYDMEENCRMERLVEFKISYGNAIDFIKKCLDKFFKNMSDKDKTDFLFSFLPFMYGIYPYTFVTSKQKEAMTEAKVSFEYLSIYEMSYMGILKLLKNMRT